MQSMTKLAAILKAYYLRNSSNEQLKEVMTMELNEQSTYLPYLLSARIRPGA